jgi:hypothetical protein
MKVGLSFALLAALFYAPILAGVRAFPNGDFSHHFFPFMLYQHARLQAGELALWNPYTYGGHPFLADVQAALFYPISNLILLLTWPVQDSAVRFYWLQVEAVLHTALAGWFTYLWLRDLTGSRWGGVVGGVSFALSGYVTGYAPLQLAVLRTAIWLPLLLWCLGRGWQEPRQWRWWLCSTLALSAAFLAGHSQSFLLLGYAAAVWTVLLAVVHSGQRMAGSVGTATVLLVTIGLTAAQWLPSTEFVRYSVRANVSYAFVSGGLNVADFWQIVLPGVLTQFSPLYVGVVGLVLAVVALFTLTRPPDLTETGGVMRLLPWRAGILFCIGVALFALLASLGGNGPLYPLLYRVAPGWAWFRGQERAAYLVALALSALAAYGAAALPTVSYGVRRRVGMMAGAGVVASVYAFGLLWQLGGRSVTDHVGYLIVAGLTLVLGLAGALVMVLPQWSARRAVWLVVLTIVNLVWANAGTNAFPGTPADRVRVAPEVAAVTQAVAATEGATGVPGRVYNEYRAYEDYGMVVGVEDVWGSSPLRVARYAALFDQFPLDRMWQLLGVQHVLTWRRELFGPSEVLAEFPQAADTTYLHRLTTSYPRAWFVAEARVMDDARTLELLADHRFDLTQTALLGPEAAFPEVAGDAPVAATIAMQRARAEAFTVTTQSDQDALLVISERWLPGWEVIDATCDGGACPAQDGQGRSYFQIMRANLALLGLWLPAGNHTFTLRYNPLSVQLGLWISLAGAGLLILVTLWRWRHTTTRRNVVAIP